MASLCLRAREEVSYTVLNFRHGYARHLLGRTVALQAFIAVLLSAGVVGHAMGRIQVASVARLSALPQ